MRLYWWVLPLVLSFSLSASAQQTNEQSAAVTQRLSTMIESLRKLDYSGNFTFERSGQMQSLHIAHRMSDGVEQERILFLDGRYREIIRNGHQVSCVHTGQKLITYNEQFPETGFVGAKSLSAKFADYYRAVYSGHDRVANRDVVVITVEPKDPYRHGYQFFLDREFNIPLRSILFNANSKILERFQFVDINFAPVTLAMVSASDSAAVVSHPHQKQALRNNPLSVNVRPQWLPLGFTLAETGIDNVAGMGAEVTTYSDGLATLSVVVEPITSSEANNLDVEGKARLGGTVALTRTAFIAQQGFLITVVGEVPFITAAKVARSVSLQYNDDAK